MDGCKANCGIYSHAESHIWQGTASVTHTREADNMKMPVRWTSVSDSCINILQLLQSHKLRDCRYCKDFTGIFKIFLTSSL